MGNKVTQEDRDAAADATRANHTRYPWSFADRIKAGTLDHHPLVQAFARHRQQAIAQHEGGRGEPVEAAYREGHARGRADGCMFDEDDDWQGSEARAGLIAHPPATRPAVLVEDRDIYEVANQLAGYIGPDTSDELTAFLWRESQHAVKLADRITQQAEEVRVLYKRLAVANAARMDADEEVARLRHDLERQMAIAKEHLNENARLREALKPFADKASLPDGAGKHGFITMPASAFRAARAALNEQPGGEGEGND